MSAAAEPAVLLSFEQVFEVLKRRFAAADEDMAGLIPVVVLAGSALREMNGRHVRLTCVSRDPSGFRYTVEEI